MCDRSGSRTSSADREKDQVDEDLTCAVCGSSLIHMIHVAGNDDGVGSQEEPHDDIECNEVPPEQAKPSRAHQSAPAAKPTRSCKRPRAKPTIVHSKVVRRAVRQEMIATIPGWNRARARAVLDACQDGTFAEVVSLSSNELARILVAGEPGLAKDTELKTDLVKALKRVIQ